MFTDIAFPKDNEQEFLSMAKKLGSRLVFVYDKPKKVEGAFTGSMKPGKADLVLGGPGRNFFEHPAYKVLYGFETAEPKDGLHKRNSGMNHVLCNLAKDKEKVLAFDFNSLLKAKDRAVVLGRMQQNAMFIRKFKNEFIIASFARTPYDLRAGKDYLAMLEELGFDGKQAKRGISLLSEIQYLRM